MAKQVSWRWVAGAVCPRCKGAVQYVTDTVPDRHSLTGFSEVKRPIYVMVDKPLTEADEPVETTVEKRGHQEFTKTRWRHALDVLCPKCNATMSAYRLVAGEPEEYPPGYWVEVE